MFTAKQVGFCLVGTLAIGICLVVWLCSSTTTITGPSLTELFKSSRELGFTPDNIRLQVHDHYWDTRLVHKSVSHNFVVTQTVENMDALVVEVTITNSLKDRSVYMMCSVRDTEGHIYDNSVDAPTVSRDESLFMTDVDARSSRRGKLTYSLPRTTEGLWLDCGNDIVARIQ